MGTRQRRAALQGLAVEVGGGGGAGGQWQPRRDPGGRGVKMYCGTAVRQDSREGEGRGEHWPRRLAGVVETRSSKASHARGGPNLSYGPRGVLGASRGGPAQTCVLGRSR